LRLVIAAYQFPMNALALSFAAEILKKKGKAPRGAFQAEANRAEPE